MCKRKARPALVGLANRVLLAFHLASQTTLSRGQQLNSFTISPNSFTLPRSTNAGSYLTLSTTTSSRISSTKASPVIPSTNVLSTLPSVVGFPSTSATSTVSSSAAVPRSSQTTSLLVPPLTSGPSSTPSKTVSNSAGSSTPSKTVSNFAASNLKSSSSSTSSRQFSNTLITTSYVTSAGGAYQITQSPISSTGNNPPPGWNSNTFVAFGAFDVFPFYANTRKYRVNGLCKLWVDSCSLQTAIRTDIKVFDTSGAPVFRNQSLLGIAHNQSCSSAEGSYFRFFPQYPAEILVNQMRMLVVGPALSNTSQFQYAFSADNKPLSWMIRDPVTNENMFCCQFEFLSNPLCTPPQNACSKPCIVGLIVFFLTMSLLMSCCSACYLKNYIGQEVSCERNVGIDSIKSEPEKEDELKGVERFVNYPEENTAVTVSTDIEIRSLNPVDMIDGSKSWKGSFRIRKSRDLGHRAGDPGIHLTENGWDSHEFSLANGDTAVKSRDSDQVGIEDDNLIIQEEVALVKKIARIEAELEEIDGPNAKSFVFEDRVV